MVKLALLVGCNYPGTKCELKGSVHDVERMRILLVKRFGFDPDQILTLVDTDTRSVQPTGANIRQCLRKVVDKVQPGDVFLFHFSGHGTRVPSETGMRGDTGYDECIVPNDMNLLSDDDFRELVNRIPPGVNFTFIADACHSGGLIECEKQQIGGGYGGQQSGGRPPPRPQGRPGRPPAGGGNEGLMGLVSEGIGAYNGGAGGGGKKNPILSAVGQALGSRFNKSPKDQKDREFDPQDIDAYGRQPESPYHRGYPEGGSSFPPGRPNERRDARDPQTGYDDRGSGYPPERTYDRREARGPESGYTDRGSRYATDQKFMISTPRKTKTGFADIGTGYTTDVKFMRSAYGEPDIGYADRAFGYPPERTFEGPGSSYAGSYPLERPTFGPPGEGAYGYPGEEAYERHGMPIRPEEDMYGYPHGGAYEGPGRPIDDEYNYPPRGGYERPGRPEDDDYGYPPGGAYDRPVRHAGEDGYPPRGAYSRRPMDDYRRPEQGSYGYSAEDAYGRYEGDSHERYGLGRHGNDPREEERLNYERREKYGREHDRRDDHGEGSGFNASQQYPPNRPSEYPQSGGSYGGHPETGEGYRRSQESGGHGYSGKPHHSPLSNKSLDIQTLSDILSERTGQSVRLGNIRQSLYKTFGEDASPMVKFFVDVVLQKLQESGVGGPAGGGGSDGQSHGLLGKIGGIASQLMKTKLTNDHGPNSPTGGSGYGGHGGGYGGHGGGGVGGFPGVPSSLQEAYTMYKGKQVRKSDSGILISACEPSESSADADPTGNPKDAYGALSNAIQTIVGESRGPLTNRQLVMASRKLLSQQGYQQHPCLYSSDRLADAPFLSPVS